MSLSYEELVSGVTSREELISLQNQLHVICNKVDEAVAEDSRNLLEDCNTCEERVNKLFELTGNSSDFFEYDTGYDIELHKKCRKVLDMYYSGGVAYYISLGQILLENRKPCIEDYEGLKELWFSLSDNELFSKFNFFKFIRKCFDICRQDENFVEYGNNYSDFKLKVESRFL